MSSETAPPGASKWRWRHWSIHSRLWLATALPALLVLAVLLLGFYERHQSELTEALTERVTASAKQLAGAVEFPLFAGDYEAIQRIAENTLKVDPDLLRVAVFPTQGGLHAAAGRSDLPDPRTGAEAGRSQHRESISVWQPVVLHTLNKSDALFDNPVGSGRGRESGASDPVIGQVLLDVSLATLEQRRRDLLLWATSTTIVVLGLAGLLSFALSRSVTRPIAAIAEGVRRIGAGDGHARIDTSDSGPLQSLALGINDMAARVEVSQEQLQTQVNAARTELQLAFDKLRDSDRQAVVAQERQRLIRDIHDGVGSQLVQILNLLHRPLEAGAASVLTTMAQHALEDLRMTLDSLEPMEGDLAAILGTLRYRIAPGIEAAGIELCWEVEDVTPIPTLGAQGVLNLFRCLQEVCANAVQHAQATTLRVRTWETAGQVHLMVEDNGRGLSRPIKRSAGGRGLAHIQARSQAMGASVRYYDAQPGTRVEWTFPISNGA